MKYLANRIATTAMAAVLAASALAQDVVVDTGSCSLLITKRVTVNGESTTSPLADGTYVFHVASNDGLTEEDVPVTIQDGSPGSVLVDGLPSGEYTVTEDTDNLPEGMSVVGDDMRTVTIDGGDLRSEVVFTNDFYLPPVPYLDPTTHTTNTCEVYTFYDGRTTLDGGWWVVADSRTVDGTRIVISGDVHLILCDGKTLTASRGINVGVNGAITNSLTIWAQSDDDGMGALTATGRNKWAGIGSEYGWDGGNVTINGGAVTATGASGGAGVGGGGCGAGGSITINGGMVIATGGLNGGAGIGGGDSRDDVSYSAPGGSITINGGTVIATGGFTGGAGIGGGGDGTGGTVTITGGTVIATGGEQEYASVSYGGAGIGGGCYGAGGTVTITGGSVTAIAGTGAQAIGHGQRATGEGTLDFPEAYRAYSHETNAVPVLATNRMATCRGARVKLTLCNPHECAGYRNNGTNHTRLCLYCDAEGATEDHEYDNYVCRCGAHGPVPYLDPTTHTTNFCNLYTLYDEQEELTNGWYVVADDATATDRIRINGDIHLILVDGRTLTASRGVNVGVVGTTTNSLTIWAQSDGEGMGALTATGGNYQAGIGGDDMQNGGNITICGGTIMASGDINGAGIGGSGGANNNRGAGGNITILGGTITANGGRNGAGIGGGFNQSCGAIIINGGAVAATGGIEGAGIGSGPSNTLRIDSGQITIQNAMVVATGGTNGGAGIGGGRGFTGGEITINGGEVTATGGNSGAGIGGGDKGAGGNINITGGTVTATSGGEMRGGAGIGGGNGGAGGTIIISGESTVVNATGGGTDLGGAGIGGGYGAGSGNITICGGMVTATGGGTSSGGAGIGGGYVGAGSTVTITGGTVTAIAGESAQAIGHGKSATNEGSLDFPVTYRAYSHETNAVPVLATNRMAACRGARVKLTLCNPHECAGYRNNVENHTRLCLYCGAEGATENHEYDNYVCPCGAHEPVPYLDPTTHTTNTCETYTFYDGRDELTNGWWVVADNATNDARIVVSGDVHLILCDGKTLTASQGVNVGVDGATTNSLTIWAQSDGAGMGALTATGGHDQTGIGGSFDDNDSTVNGSGGNITICGGAVTATGGEFAAGIGGSFRGDGGMVVVNDGTVTATGGEYAAGVGGGGGGDGGTITINGGMVAATGGDSAAGIGGGAGGGSGGWFGSGKGRGGDITITGGTVNAQGDWWGAGIGGGFLGDGGTITITDGTVTATGGEYAAGVGGGCQSAGGEITISGGTITAIGGTGIERLPGGGAGVGGGEKGAGGKITITGGTVTAIAGEYIGGDGKSPQAIGHGHTATDEGDLDFPDTYCAYSPETNSVPVDATNRMAACRGDRVKLTLCDPHGYADYRNNGDNHTRFCRYCGAEGATEQHEYEDGVCACGAIITYPLWVDGRQVCSTNQNDILGDGTASFTGTTTNGTLALTDARITGAYKFSGYLSALIYAGVGFDLTVSLSGSNRLETASSSENAYGIATEEKAVVTGNGVVVIETGHVGIDSKNISLNGATVITACSYIGLVTSGDIMVSNAVVRVTSAGGYDGIRSNAGDIVIVDSDIAITGVTDDDFGIFCYSGKISISGRSTVTAESTVEGNALAGDRGIEIGEGLAVVEPAGGRLGDDGRTIVDASGHQVKKVVIRPYKSFASTDIELTDCEFVYDGAGHTIGVETNGAIAGLVLKYCGIAAAEAQSLTTNHLPLTTDKPGYTNVCDMVVYVEASAPGYITETNSATVKITPRPVTFAGKSETKLYTGSEIEITDVVVTNLVDGQTHNVAFSASGTEVGGPYAGTITATNSVVIKSGGTDVTGNYAVTVVNGALTIAQDPALSFEVSLAGKSCTYDGQPHALPGPATNTAASGATTVEYSRDQSNWTADLSSLTAIAVADSSTIYVRASNPNYVNVASNTAALTISPLDLAGATISAIATQYYDGRPLTPAFTVQIGGLRPAAGTDYTVSYAGNDRPGTATVTVTGKGNYTGRKQATFKILPARQTFTVKVGKWGRARVEVGGVAQTVGPNATKAISVPYGQAVKATAVPDAGFAVSGAASASYASFTRDASASFAFVPKLQGATIRWKFSSAVGRYFAQVSIPSYAGYNEALGGLSFIFADRKDAAGTLFAQLWNASKRAPYGGLVTDGGVAYRGVGLGASAFAGKGGGTRVVFGVSNATLAKGDKIVPAGERKIGMYVRNRVNPSRGNESAADVGSFTGCLTWTTAGRRYYLPIVQGAANGPVSTTAAAARPSVPVYVVVFNANGGRGAMASQAVSRGAKAQLKACAFTRNGYTFAGWAKSAALAQKGAVAYKNKAAVRNLAAAGKSVTVYAVWKRK